MARLAMALCVPQKIVRSKLHTRGYTRHFCTDRHAGWSGANWGGNVRYVGSTLLEPTSVEQLQDAVSNGANKRIRALGSAHSFTPLVSSGPELEPDVTLVSLHKLPRLCVVDHENKTMTVDAGTTYSEVCAHLAAHTSYALSTTASLPHFSVAGAIATGTHGSSGLGPDGRLKLAGLADAVTAIELIGADGEARTIASGDADFDCAVVSLGLLGVATRITLQLVDGYDVRQRVYGAWPPSLPTDVPQQSSSGGLSQLLDSLPEAMAQTDSFSAFVQWHADDGGMLILRDKVPRPHGSDAAAPAPPAPVWPPSSTGNIKGMPLRHAPVRPAFIGSTRARAGFHVRRPL